MNRIRVATSEEVEKVKDFSDLDLGCVALALDTQRGTGIAIRRICTEVDPMISGQDWTTRDKVLFIRDIETVLSAQGTSHYYFNVLADDANKEWRENLVHWGAEQVSTAPVLRYKKIL